MRSSILPICAAAMPSQKTARDNPVHHVRSGAAGRDPAFHPTWSWRVWEYVAGLPFATSSASKLLRHPLRLRPHKWGLSVMQ